MKILPLLFFIISIQCFSQENVINSDTILINTHLPSTTVYKRGLIPIGKTYCAWFALVNDSGHALVIDRITTGDGGTYAKANGKKVVTQKLAANDTLTFCVFFVKQEYQRMHTRDIRIIGMDPDEKVWRELLEFKLVIE